MHPTDAILREAFVASWGADTSYDGTFDGANPARGQCYPTARVVQHLFPACEIAKGRVDTGVAFERHFWNVIDEGGSTRRLDLTWKQFPPASAIRTFVVLDRAALGDRASTVRRCEVLLERVIGHLARRGQLRPDEHSAHPRFPVPPPRGSAEPPHAPASSLGGRLR